MSNKKLTGTLIPKDNKKAKMHATFYSDKPVGSGGDSEIFDEYIDATDQQRNTALANVSNQTANSTSGKMGYKVLDPTKTFAEQVTAENTIYEIRDVFDLGGTQETPVSVTIPEGSTLKFNGGVIKNCTLVNAYVDAARENIFDTSVNFTNLKNATVYPEWWGAVADGTTDNSDAFAKALSLYKTVSIGRGTYVVTQEISCSVDTSIIGENKANSVIKTNGIKLNRKSVVSNVTVSSISKTTPYLLKISNSITPYNEYFLRITIDNVDLIGADFSEYDTQVYGIVLECEVNSNNAGFYGVNITNVNFSGRMLYGIYFNAVDAGAWITYVNFVNIFINAAKYPIEFTSVRNITEGTFFNFQNIYFRNVCAQCNTNSSVTPSVVWTESFVRIDHLSGGIFDACNCVDAPDAVKQYYFKSTYSVISLINFPSTSVLNNLARHDNVTSEYILADNLAPLPTTLYRAGVLDFKTAEQTDKVPDNSASPSKSIFRPVHHSAKGFIGFRISNNIGIHANNNYKFLGVARDGHIVHSGATEPNTEFKLKNVYSTGYIPVYSTTLPTINDLGGLARGAFVWSSNLLSLVTFDTYAGIWSDALGVRVYGGMKRKGTTADRPVISSTAGCEGFLFFDTDLDKWICWNGTKWTNIDGSTLAPTKGADTDRPTLTSSDAGFQYFDTTLNKPIWWTGTDWVDATGTVV